MIVDSPGIGESDVMSEFVLNYLPRAFCFMYVINSVNAGGIQDDRVRAKQARILQKKQIAVAECNNRVKPLTHSNY